MSYPSSGGLGAAKKYVSLVGRIQAGSSYFREGKEVAKCDLVRYCGSSELEEGCVLMSWVRSASVLQNRYTKPTERQIAFVDIVWTRMHEVWRW